jgi:DNA modification methylase
MKVKVVRSILEMSKKLEDYLYYEEKDPDLKIYHGDCLEIMPLLPKVDLVLTDPPYGIAYNNKKLNRYSHSKFDDIHNDNITMDFKFLFDFPVFKIVFGCMNFLDQLPSKGRWICWDKRVTELADGVFGDPFEMAWMNKETGYNKIYRVMHGGVINADGANQPRFHPTQKPVILFKKILLDLKLGLVLDPFLGSGTTLLACKELNRNGIGIEINEKYCEIAKKRLKATCKPLFTDVNGAKGNSNVNTSQSVMGFDAE